MILFDAVHGVLGAARAPAEGEPGGDGVEIIGEAAGEAGQAGQVRREGLVGPGGQEDAGLLGEHVTEVTDELVRGGRLGAGVQDRFELPVFVLGERAWPACEPAGDLPRGRRGRLWGPAGLVQAVPRPVAQRGVAALPAAFGEFAVQGGERDAAAGLGDASGEVGVVDSSSSVFTGDSLLAFRPPYCRFAGPLPGVTGSPGL
ncbi:hypothetical protein [Streptomyces sp. GESEQ-35]|uniref:hypothetical protein n=1 Tax=Streptomyces sp. GESEQ-35 TaxID=2812657 RepID=UPI001B322EA8|nr:hypothetical protein [Streptomyces sp. GESEQ-35]